MKKLTLVCALILCTVRLQAAEMSYTNVSKYMLNNAYVQSPVYTKKMFRSIRETDTYNYQAQLAELDMLKENRQISTREYNEKKAALEREYQKVYGQFNPAAQAGTIKQTPVESFYYGAMEPGQRLKLMSLSSQELTDEERGMPTPQLPIAQTPSSTVAQTQTVQNPPNRRSILHLQAQAPYEDNMADITTQPSSRPLVTPKKNVLGKKAIPVKIGAF